MTFPTTPIDRSITVKFTGRKLDLFDKVQEATGWTTLQVVGWFVEAGQSYLEEHTSPLVINSEWLERTVEPLDTQGLGIVEVSGGSIPPRSVVQVTIKDKSNKDLVLTGTLVSYLVNGLANVRLTPASLRNLKTKGNTTPDEYQVFEPSALSEV